MSVDASTFSNHTKSVKGPKPQKKGEEEEDEDDDEEDNREEGEGEGGTEVEISEVVMFSPGENVKQLLPSLWQQKGSDIVELLRCPVVWRTEDERLWRVWEKMIRYVKEEMRLDKSNLNHFFGRYVDGLLYTKGRNYKRLASRLSAIRTKGNVLPYAVAKQTLEAVFIALQGITFYRSLSIHRSFVFLWAQQRHLLDPASQSFVDGLWRLRTHPRAPASLFFDPPSSSSSSSSSSPSSSSLSPSPLDDPERGGWSVEARVRFCDELVAFRATAFARLAEELTASLRDTPHLDSLGPEDHLCNAARLSDLLREMSAPHDDGVLP